VMKSCKTGVKNWRTLAALWAGTFSCNKRKSREQKSYFSIRRTTVLGMFKDCAIILGAIRRSFLTKSVAIAAMFTSVRVGFGRPPLSSSSTCSLLSRSREYHLETFGRFRASFPQVFCTNTSVSVADRPTLKQNFMATRCSFPQL
jgi:hypothetical protein